jgi:excisionase family DNA binding protein
VIEALMLYPSQLMKKRATAQFSQILGQGNPLTVGEVADYLRVHPSTVYRLVRARQIKGFKIGGLWRFNPADLESLWTQIPPDKTRYSRRS